MLGAYYKPQLTSVLSITHRFTGIVLSLLGAPLLLWWIVATSGGAESYQAMSACLSGWIGKLVALAISFSLSFHFCNGIRHLVWDTGRMLHIKDAYTSGWLALAGSVVMTAVFMGVLL